MDTNVCIKDYTNSSKEDDHFISSHLFIRLVRSIFITFVAILAESETQVKSIKSNMDTAKDTHINVRK